jgi:hypothetical protein
MKNQDDSPTDTLILQDSIPTGNGESKDKILGGTALEYNSDAGPLKYLIGTE